jgi:hypothetical protein
MTVVDQMQVDAITDLYNWIALIVSQFRNAVNGGMELGENLGEAVTGTTNATAHGQVVVNHGLQRKPKYLWVTPETDPATTQFPVVFYWKPDDYTAWSDTAVYFRCNQPSVGYRGFVV